MTIAALPDGWIIDEGVLNTDITEDTTTYLRDGRSMRFEPTDNQIRIMSKTFPVGAGGLTQWVARRIYGFTVVFYLSNPVASGTLNAGFYFYDASGGFLSSSVAFLPSAAGGVWSSEGFTMDTPTNAYTARLVIEYKHPTEYCLVDSFIPYLMPPFGQGWIDPAAAPVALAVGVNTVIPIVMDPVSTNGHAITSTTPTAGIICQETGTYIVGAHAELNDFDSGDAFNLQLYSLQPGFREGQLFTPSLALSALTNPSKHLHVCYPLTLNAGDVVNVYAQQFAGTPREIVDAEVILSKES